MLCPECGEENNRVIDTTQKNDNIVERVRKCLCCGFPWLTEEKEKEFKKEEESA